MKVAVYFLTILGSTFALPDLNWSKIKPKDVYVEPINPVEDIYQGRIIGGSEVTRNTVPYQVGIIIDNSGFCGGSLIATTRVLTAAHCTIGASFVQVRAGAHMIMQNEATQQRITSSSIVNHLNYNAATLANDISVIILPSAFTLNSNVQLISLAPASAGDFAGSEARLTGWGKTSDSSNALSPVLRSVFLSIITNSACESVFGSMITSSDICTSGARTVGGCNGDSGGPLVVTSGDSGVVQVGIVSFGSRRCQAGYPTVYTRVSSYRSWISQHSGV